MNRSIHRISQFLVTLLILAAWSGVVLAQDQPSGQGAGNQGSGGQGTSDQGTSDQGPTDAAPAATGLDNSSENTENPPLSGLDQPSFEPGYGARSYLAVKAQASESASSNPNAAINNTGAVKDITRLMGSLDLQKLWKLHPLDVDYIGGAAWFHGTKVNNGWYQVHNLDATQRILWRTGQLAIRDNFSYMPQGSFGFGSFGGAGGFGGLGGVGGGLGPGLTPTVGTNGNTPRIDNLGIMDVTQSVSPRASVVLMGGYGVLHFLNSPPGFLNAEQTMAQAGYNYLLTRRDQIAVSYGYQELHFPRAGAGSVNVNLWQGYYAHRISGKLDFNIGGGPQWIHANGTTIGFTSLNPPTIGLVPIHKSSISGAGRVGLIYYRSSRTNMALTYSRYTTAGSGFFAGANTNLVRYTLNHQLTRRWSTTLDGGYSRNSRILASASNGSQSGTTRKYGYWYAGGSMRRQLTRTLQGFMSYQYDQFKFGAGFSGAGGRSGYDRHVGTIGLDWTPRPIRLD